MDHDTRLRFKTRDLLRDRLRSTSMHPDSIDLIADELFELLYEEPQHARAS
jgi:uncharacterized protein YkuJ